MTKKIIIEGMSCGHCVKRVENALVEVDGVASITVDLDDKVAVVELNGETSDEILKAVVEDAGYEVVEIS